MEKQALNEIHERLKSMLLGHVPPLQVRKDNENVLELAGTKQRMQGRQMVDGFYFASIVPKPKDIRLYFFPIYTHPENFTGLSENLRKYLKGKSCFHIKKMDAELDEEIGLIISKGVAVYKEADLI